MKKTFSNVVIIGAGFSGLSAAATLVQNGFQNVIILEARNRIGGRFSVETHNGHVLHMGAQWVHGVSSSSNNSDNTTDDANSETNSMFVLAKNYGLLDENMPRDGFGDMNHESFELEHVYLKGGENIPEKYTEMAGQVYSKICSDWGNFSQFDDDHDVSIEEAFKVLAEKELETLKTDLNPKEFNYVETVLFGCFKNILVGYAGDTITNCSAKIFGVSDELPGGDLILPTSILDKMYLEIPCLEKILRLNHRVSKINWKNESDDKKIVIEVENCKEVFETDFVICTFPPGVMKKYHEHIFNPRLPEEKIQAYNQICPGAICKYFVEWNKPWRKESNTTPIMIAWDRKDLENIDLPQDWIKGCFEIVNIDPFGTLMMLWIVGDCAKAADTLEDEDVSSTELCDLCILFEAYLIIYFFDGSLSRHE